MEMRTAPFSVLAVVVFAVAGCSSNKATVAKHDPQPTGGRGKFAQTRRASPEKSGLTPATSAQAALTARAPVPPRRPAGLGPQHYRVASPSVRSSSSSQNAPRASETSRPAQIAAGRSSVRTGPSSTSAVGPGPAALQDPAETGAGTQRASPAVEAIVYDVASGIKTVFLADGTVQEDLFDLATLPSIKAAKPGDKDTPRVRIVNEDALPEPARPGR